MILFMYFFSGLSNCTWFGIARCIHNLWLCVSIDTTREDQHRWTIFGEGKIIAIATYWITRFAAWPLFIHSQYVWFFYCVRHIDRFRRFFFFQSLLTRFWCVCFFFYSKYGYRDIYVKRLHPKTLSKLIKRLAKQYRLPDDVTPNVTKGKIRGQLQFLMRKNYIEKSLSKDAWRELVLEIVSMTTELDLKLELIDGCSFNDVAEASYWAR